MKTRTLAVLIVLSKTSTVDSASIAIDPSLTFQTMQGFGSSQRLFKDPHLIGGPDSDQDSGNGLNISYTDQNVILDRLYRDMGLTRMRLGIYPIAIEPINDNNDPNVTDLSKFNFAWKMNDGFIDYVSRSVPRGLTTWWHSPANLESWMNESNPAEYIEWAMAICRRWRAAGLEFPYWSIMNEPSYIRGGIWSGNYLKTTVKLLGAKFAAEGFRTKIVIPDDVRSTDAEILAKVVLEDPEARQYVGAIAFHLYDEPFSNALKMKALGAQYNLPLWMSEYSVPDGFNWVMLMQDLIADCNVSAVDHMGGFGLGGGGYINFSYSGTNYLGYTLPKKYYYAGQFSRFVLPGQLRMQAASSDPNVKISAFKSDSGVVLVAINTTGSSVSADFSFAQSPRVMTFRPIFTNASSNWVQSAPITAAANGSFNAVLSPYSVTTFLGTSQSTPIQNSKSSLIPEIKVNLGSLNGHASIRIIPKSRSLSKAELFDLSGQMLAHREFTNAIDWEIPGLKQGLFFLKIQIGKNQHTQWLQVVK